MGLQFKKYINTILYSFQANLAHSDPIQLMAAYKDENECVYYSGGSYTEHLNSEPIQNLNVLKIGIGMVPFGIIEAIATMC